MVIKSRVPKMSYFEISFSFPNKKAQGIYMDAIDESAIATQTFLNYSQTFEQMVATGDAKIIVPFLHIPAILIAPGQDPILMTSESAITVVFGQLIQQLKDAHFDHSKLMSINAKGLSPTEVIISGTATRYQDKAET